MIPWEVLSACPWCRVFHNTPWQPFQSWWASDQWFTNIEEWMNLCEWNYFLGHARYRLLRVINSILAVYQLKFWYVRCSGLPNHFFISKTKLNQRMIIVVVHYQTVFNLIWQEILESLCYHNKIELGVGCVYYWWWCWGGMILVVLYCNVGIRTKLFKELYTYLNL